MRRPGRWFGGLVGSLAVAVAGLTVMTSSALAVSVPGTPTTSSPRNLTTPWTFSWGPAVPDLAESIVGYVGGPATAGAPEPTDPIVSGEQVAVAETDSVFYVAALLDGGVIGPYASTPIAPDFTPPSLDPPVFDGTLSAGGWYRELILRLTCADGLQPAICPDVTWDENGNFGANARTVRASDDANNVTIVGLPAFKFDATRPSLAGQPLQPGTNALVAEEPLFTWTRGTDALSGVDRYELQYRRTDEDTWTTIATAVDPPVGTPSARRDSAEPLPLNVPLEWRVVTYDNAGNSRPSARQGLTVDPTIPAAPTITGGPNALTRDPAPTFTWEGIEKNFRWDVTAVGAQTPLRQGGGNANQTTLAALPDGDYTFRVTQITAAGQGSAEATRSFKVDTTPPVAPTILTRPTFPAISAAPVFTWSIEPGAYSRWSVLNAGGTLVAGPIDTPVTSAELPPLAAGSYTFQVQQIDAAGNISPATTEAFTLLAPLVEPAPSPSVNPRTAFIAALPKQNALRLLPKAGTTLPTLRPVLRWKKGPRGTQLYNLQIFEVTRKANASKPKVTKILSRFPRGRQFRVATKSLNPGTCYVWRVWPYTGTAFTTRPVGVSNFCIAGKKVLRTKALAKRAALAKVRAGR